MVDTKDQRVTSVGTLVINGVPHTVYGKMFGTVGKYQIREKGYASLSDETRLKFPTLVPMNPVMFDRWEGDGEVGKCGIYNWNGNGGVVSLEMGELALNSMSVPNFTVQPIGALSSEVCEKALLLALSRVDLNSFMGTNSMIEAKDTLELMKNPLKSLSTAFRSYTKKARKLYKSKLTMNERKYIPWGKRHRLWIQSASETWLTARYGIQPLLYDVVDAAESVADQILGTKDIYAARGSHKTEVQVSDGFLNGDWLPMDWPISVRVRSSFTKTVRGKCSYVIRYAPRAYMKDAIALSRWGLSPTQTLEILYEATPFSWMFDWVSNFGQWLKAIRPKPELEIIDVCKTETWIIEIDLNVIASACGYSNGSGSGHGELKRYYMKRIAVENTLQMPRPSFNADGLNVIHALDAVSLGLSTLLGTLNRKL